MPYIEMVRRWGLTETEKRNVLRPPADRPPREMMGYVATLTITLNPANIGRLLTTPQALRNAREMFAADTTKAMSRVNFVIVRMDTAERWLISVGPKGGWRKEWNFGNG